MIVSKPLNKLNICSEGSNHVWIVLVAGVEQVYVHVHKNNSVAQELYQKTGFEVKTSNSLL